MCSGRPAPAPAGLGLAGAVARARPLHTSGDRGGLWRAVRRRPLDPPRGRALARTQPVRPAVQHPAPTWPQASVPEALERSPLLPHHPLPRPGPRLLPVPLGMPEHHHRRLPHRPAHHPPRGAWLAGAPVRTRAAQAGWPRWRPHRTVRVSGVCALLKPPRRAADGVGESLWRLERQIPAAWLPVMALAV